MATTTSSQADSSKGNMWMFDQKFDQPMDEEAGRIRHLHLEKNVSSASILRLAFQSLGVVFGDLGTSPLYVFSNTFPRGVDNPEDVVGALSVIIYSLTIVVLLKYVIVVLRANDNGQGGTFALYSLLCRHAKIKTIPDQHRTDEELTTYSCQTIEENSLAAKVKLWLEAHAYMKNVILILVLLGTCMVIGDGILTPAISVLSAASGIKVNHPERSNDVVIIVAVIILVGLFSMQHYGTDRVGWLFAPLVLLWFITIGGIGAWNIWKYDHSVLRAFSPVCLYRYLRRGYTTWASLGGIMLCITGAEALFVDVCFFPVLAIQVAFTVVVFPCLLLAYTGQAAFIMRNTNHVADAFYHSIPNVVYWPVFIVATLAAVIASQATISATFSIINQAHALKCFPRVKIVHTSKIFHSQIYIPDINWVLMILCIAVTTGFRDKSQIGNAYGTAVVMVMLVTTFLMFLIILLVWRSHWTVVIAFACLSLLVELTYLSAVLLKVDQGGWVPLVIAATFLLIMYVWQYGTQKRYEFEMQSKVSMAWIIGLGSSLGLVRVPGIGIVYTDLASGVPHIFSHFITNLPAIHSVVIFVCVKYLPVHTVPIEERFLVKRIGPKNYHMFRCVVRYGYRDLHKKEDFEKKLFDSLTMLVHTEAMDECYSDFEDDSEQQQNNDCSTVNASRSSSTLDLISDDSFEPMGSVYNDAKSAGRIADLTVQEELEFLNKCQEAGVVHILGNTMIRSQRNSNILKRIAIDYIYEFLARICRENSVIFNVPHESLLNVGQVLYV
ncbi:putative potassium transporter 11 [Canna indica]|uniref:Potassium transporter n=1 Tax=Canna indica TaxID=4628 RepID=A0AAQ3K0L9_9LILI|nr:putative potassium transporter 11 [Canna indica]